VIADQHVPVLGRLSVTIGLARPSFDQRDPLLAFAVDICPGVEGVLQQRYHVAIAERRPIEARQALPVRGTREEQAFRSKRQMRLARAAKLAEPRKHQPDRLLQPEVRVEAEAEVSMPDIADRHADPQLTPARLRSRGVVHARTDHAELELADAALHSKEQPIVRPAGVVDAVEVDHPSLDQPAELEQVMPVPAVARQPRGVEAEHRADLAGAKRSDELLKTRPCDHAAGGPAQVVVDHLDGAEAAAASDVDQLVLPTPALGIRLDLPRRRLPHVDHRLALQNGRRKDLNACHRSVPPLRSWLLPTKPAISISALSCWTTRATPRVPIVDSATRNCFVSRSILRCCELI